MKRITSSLLFLILLAEILPGAFSQHYTETFGWSFDNYTTPELSWDLYRDTFIGIPPNHDPLSSGFDVLFYDQVYKTELAAEGNCYGLSLMSLLMRKKGGHLGHCLPVSQYSGTGSGPTSAQLSYYINQMHGHQVNVPSLKQYLELLATGKTRDGLFAFEQAQYYQAQDDYTLVSITESILPTDGGHTMVAYETRDFGANDKRIYVYDPNRSWYIPTQQTFYTSAANYIQIKADHSWKFEKVSGATPEYWEGSPTSGGNCIITPISLAGPRGRTPSSLGLNALSFASEFFIFGSGTQLSQMTDGEGKRLFKPGTQEIETDPNQGMLNTVPYYPSDGHAPYDFSIYYQLERPKNGTLDVQVQSRGTGYRLDVAGKKSHLQINALGGQGIDRLKLTDYGTDKPRLTIYNDMSVPTYDVVFTQIIKPDEEMRIIRIGNIKTPGRVPVEIGLLNEKTLDIGSLETNLALNLQMETVGRDFKSTVDLRDVRIQPGQKLTFQPIDWRNLNEKDVRIIQDRLTPGRQ